MTPRNNALAVAVLVALGLLSLSACSFIVEVDGRGYDVRVYAPTHAQPTGAASPTPTHTPTATPTATVTHTPTSTLTHTPTPGPTNTPLYGTEVPPPPTLTPTPAPSVTPLWPTPTPDVLPSPTPGPSATPAPLPDDAVCMAGAAVNLNVRADHTTDAAVIGRLDAGTRAEIVALHVVSLREEWAQLADGGWIALLHSGVRLAYPDDTAACWELPETGQGAVRFGFHHLPGAGGASDTAFAQQVSACKDVETRVCPQIAAVNPDVVTVYRALNTDYGMRDCPPDWMWSDPSQWWAGVRDRLPAGYDYYEVNNECGPPPQGWSYWAQWSIELAQMVERDTGGAMLAFSFAPGNPDLPHWSDLAAYVAWADQHGRETGVWHGIALHQAVYASWSRTDMPWVNEPYIAGRHMLVRNIVLSAVGVDLAASRVPVVVTEGGLSDGYSGNWHAAYSCAEAADAARVTVDTLAEQGVIDAWTWWNLGAIGIWTSDHDCTGAMVGAVQQ